MVVVSKIFLVGIFIGSFYLRDVSTMSHIVTRTKEKSEVSTCAQKSQVACEHFNDKPARSQLNANVYRID